MQKTLINVIGVHQKIEAYPNVLFLLEALSSSKEVNIQEYNVPMCSGSLSSKKSLLIKAKNLFKAITAHVKIVFYLLSSPKRECVYIPYPATFVALSLIMVPRSKKPKKVVMDAFISIYDTAVIDRKLFSKKSFIAKLLKKVEKLAFKQAHVVVTDTPQNSQYYAHIFGLAISKFKAIPLATDETHFKKMDYSHLSPDGIFNIIFIGTLIPLHGIKTVLKAAELLSKNKNIQFTIIGNGQMAVLIEEALKNGSINIKWIQQWQTSKELVAHLSQANLALGIFGTGDKTQRVCPFKLYVYMRCGLPIITGGTEWSKKATKSIDYLPFMTVSVGNPQELAEIIYQCCKSEDLCIEQANNSQQYYDSKLSNKNIIQRFEDIFTS